MLVTKLRSSKVLRFIGIVLVALSIPTIIFYTINKEQISGKKNYFEVKYFQDFIHDKMYSLMDTLALYKGSEKIVPLQDIKGSDLVTDNDVKLEFKEKNQRYNDRVFDINKENDALKAEAIYKKYDSRVIEIDKEREDRLKYLKEQYYKSEESIREELENQKKYEFKNKIGYLYESRFNYIIVNKDGTILTNFKEGYSEEALNKQKKNNDFFIVFRGEDLNNSLTKNESSYDDETFRTFLKNNNSLIDELKNKEFKLVGIFAKKDELEKTYIGDTINRFNFYYEHRETIENIFNCVCISLIIGLFIVAISKIKQKSIFQKIYEKVYMEIILIIQIIGVYLFGNLFVDGIRALTSNDYYIGLEYFIVMFFCIIVGYYWIVYFIGIIKDIISKRTIKERFLIYKIFRYIKNKIRDVLLVKSTGFKFILFAIVTAVFFLICLVIASDSFNGDALLIMLPFGLIYFGILIMYGFKFTKHLNKIIDGTSKIGEGDLNHIIDENGVGILSKLAKNINGLKVGLKDALGKEMKSERMKSELITNVSHDLKTPLTSIINYVDLLKKEDLTPEKAKGYVDILDRKSQRLKSLIEDLFEASKATSGAMEMNIEKIEITELLNQTLAEFEEKIADSKLDFKVNLGTEKVYVMGDGRRTYRVFENLIQNILKYTLANTRVYIDLVETKSEIRLCMKNISAYEMNFNADEIAERFKRGDLSRNTEGSGLGLAIAKSIMELQNGKLELKIDGDLFKAVILFNK